MFHDIYVGFFCLETFTEGGGFVSKHLGNPLGNPGNPLLSTGRSDPWTS